MITMLGAIITRFNASATLAADVTASGGKLWLFEIPEDKLKNLPFVTLWHEGEVPDYTFEDAYTEDGQIRFEVYAEGAAAAELIATHIKTAFDLPDTGACRSAMPLDGTDYFESCTRANYLVTNTKERTATGGKVFQADVVYKTVVKRSL
jgi:hypothetical protein